MPDFTVDIGGLDALQKNLDRSSENIDAATKHLADLAPGDLGPQALDEACADFRADWKGGLGELSDAVSAIWAGLDNAKKAHSEIEHGIGQSLREMADSIAGGGGKQ